MKEKYSIIFLIVVVVFMLIASCAEQKPERGERYLLRDSVGNRVLSSQTITPLFGHDALEPSHVRGGRIYDDFTIELGVAVAEPNPLVGLATGTIEGNPWLCSSCHGFDYEGGILTFHNSATNNLLELREVRARDEEFVIHMLNDGFAMWDGAAVVNVHNYSAFLTPQAMVDVADFVVNEIYDTHEVIRAPTSIALGDMEEGAAIFHSPLVPSPDVPPLVRVDGSPYNCEMCHDGVNAPDVAGLKVIAMEHPFRFLHRTNFGSPRAGQSFGYGDNTVMPGMFEVVLTHGLHFGGPEESAAAMHYVQTSP